MAKQPGFFWYAKDCDTDENVRAMDDREFGFYMRCLNHAWINGGLPADLSELARVIIRTPAYVGKMWGRVGKCFQLQDGRWVNQKQEDQRREQAEFADSKRAAATTRWDRERSKRNARASTSANRVQCLASALSSTTTAEAKAGGGAEPPSAEDDERFWRTPPPGSAQFPKTAEAMGAYFPIDDKIVLDVAFAAIRAVPTAQDPEIAAAVHATHSARQASAGLWLSTVPNYLKNPKARDPASAKDAMLAQVIAKGPPPDGLRKPR